MSNRITGSCYLSGQSTSNTQIESIKTTSMEDVSTRVFEKNKEYLRRLNRKMIWYIKAYIIAYVKTQKIRYIIHYVKPTAQLLFKIRFPIIYQHLPPWNLFLGLLEVVVNRFTRTWFGGRKFTLSDPVFGKSPSLIWTHQLACERLCKDSIRI